MESNGSSIIGNSSNVKSGPPNIIMPNINQGPNVFIPPKPPIDPVIFYWIEIILRITLTGSLAVFGLVTNIINAVLFCRQGILSDGSTVSLFGLAISECFSCFFCILSEVYLGLMLWYPNYLRLSWSVDDFYYQTAIRPRSIFTQITSWITAFIAIERFISVVFPFKVKQIVTPKRCCFIVASIFLVTTALYYPQYINKKLMKIRFFFMVQYRYISTRLISDAHYKIFLTVHPVSLRLASIIIVFLCNVVIIWKVVIATKFRSKSSKATSDSKEDNKGGKDTKEQKLVRMMVVICVVFLVCVVPDICYTFLAFVLQVKSHFYIDECVFATSMFFETLSAASNIFIYFTLSTRYRKEFSKCFKCFGGANSTTSSTTSGISGSSTKVVTSITTKQ